jgi:ornithine racemase
MLKKPCFCGILALIYLFRNGVEMMKPCPRISIDINKIRHNASVLTNLCRQQGIQVAGVVKGVCGMPEVAQAMLAGGVTMLGDSRLENMHKLAFLKAPRLMLRLPMLSQAAEVVAHTDLSLNSEIKTVEALDRAARKQGRIHDIVLMVELGDLREGIPLPLLPQMAKKILSLKGVHLRGLGTNLTCYGGVIPDSENLGALAQAARHLQEELGITLDIVSGGNSSSLYLLEKGMMPAGINQLRLGDSILLGREAAFGQPVAGAREDTFTLFAEVIEVLEKASLPTGQIGRDAFGKTPVFTDRGLRKRAILAVGRQDVHPENLTPLAAGLHILGASSDHLIMDISDADIQYAVGDPVAFRPTYAGMLQLMTSPYVVKELL